MLGKICGKYQHVVFQTLAPLIGYLLFYGSTKKILFFDGKIGFKISETLLPVLRKSIESLLESLKNYRSQLLSQNKITATMHHNKQLHTNNDSPDPKPLFCRFGLIDSNNSFPPTHSIPPVLKGCFLTSEVVLHLWAKALRPRLKFKIYWLLYNVSCGGTG